MNPSTSSSTWQSLVSTLLVWSTLLEGVPLVRHPTCRRQNVLCVALAKCRYLQKYDRSCVCSKAFKSISRGCYPIAMWKYLNIQLSLWFELKNGSIYLSHNLLASRGKCFRFWVDNKTLPPELNCRPARRCWAFIFCWAPLWIQFKNLM